MAQTLLLDTAAWDLVLDINGNIAVASEPYALAQDASSEIKTFRGEIWYDTTVGINYGAIFGQSPVPQFIKAQMNQAALTVPDVASANVVISSFAQRVITGQLQVSTSSNQTVTVGFSVAAPQGTA